jgi:hypothetical protein
MIVLWMPSAIAGGVPLGSAFTYQGQLKCAGMPVNEPADLRFKLFDDPGIGVQIGATVELPSVPVTNGLFTVSLDFGAAAFTGAARWLEIEVRVPAESGSYETLNPRQALTPAPYALFSLESPDSLWESAGDDIFYEIGHVHVGTPASPSDLIVEGSTHLNGPVSINTFNAGEVVLDQAQELTNLVDHNGCDWQCFVPGVDGYLARIDVLSDPGWYWGSADLAVYEGAGPGGPVLYTATYAVGQPNPDGTVPLEIPIEDAPWLQTGAQYTFQICRTNAPIYLASGDPYGPCTSSFGADFDMWFKSYARVGYALGGTISMAADGNVRVNASSAMGNGIYLVNEDSGAGIAVTAYGSEGGGTHFSQVPLDSADTTLLHSNTDLVVQAGPDGNMYLGNLERPAVTVDGLSGNVGIGTMTPQASLHVAGELRWGEAGTAYAFSNKDHDGFFIEYAGGSQTFEDRLRIQTSHSGHSDDYAIFNLDPQNGISFVSTGFANGNVGIGTSTPDANLHIVDTDGSAHFRLSGVESWELRSETFGPTPVFSIWRKTGVDTKVMTMRVDGTEPRVGIRTDDPQAHLDVNGIILANEYRTGGADLAERFDVDPSEAIEPGTVVVIDSHNPGRLRACSKAYDHRVAGIVSGANGIHAGFEMAVDGEQGSASCPVALAGRVYCWCDASNGPIAPGDLLTTSDTPGHAMKVTGYGSARGAILGKAMSKLEDGRGFVLVLVTLQ